MGSSFVMSSFQLRNTESMAGHNDSNTSEKKSSEAANDLPTFNAENMQSNMKIIYYRFVFDTLIGHELHHKTFMRFYEH